MTSELNYDKSEYRRYMGKAEYDKAIQTLKGLFDGIVIDGVANSDEVKELYNWLAVNDQLLKYKPYDELLALLKDCLEDEVLTSEEINDIAWALDNFSASGKYYDYTTLQIQKLEGICHGIIADNTINDTEIMALNEWLSENDFVLKGTFPYEEIRALIISILDDGVITEDERNLLKVCLSEYVDCTVSYNIDFSELDDLKDRYNISGICSVNPVVTIPGHSFCLTGKSSRATRNDFRNAIIEHGGVYKKDITKDTQYLIVGDEGNPCWAFSCYGRKIELAEKMRKGGNAILIIHENDFWKCV